MLIQNLKIEHGRGRYSHANPRLTQAMAPTDSWFVSSVPSIAFTLNRRPLHEVSRLSPKEAIQKANRLSCLVA